MHRILVLQTVLFLLFLLVSVTLAHQGRIYVYSGTHLVFKNKTAPEYLALKPTSKLTATSASAERKNIIKPISVLTSSSGSAKKSGAIKPSSKLTAPRLSTDSNNQKHQGFFDWLFSFFKQIFSF